MKKLLNVLASAGKRLPAAIPDALIVSGVAAVSYGAGIFHPAAGWITCGVLMLGFGILAAFKAA